ncbi:hypothetical protein NUW54_g4613 [Trametes sanguinea]|uniref:Uncharacterized protein n=1 Tax=Trametes sanguinea TaxID=158606 RepID=A0ACC1PY02_9APHY|nr:hypothetical protein NUW54_g4613 [Trametes sanguinea]
MLDLHGLRRRYLAAYLSRTENEAATFHRSAAMAEGGHVLPLRTHGPGPCRMDTSHRIQDTHRYQCGIGRCFHDDRQAVSSSRIQDHMKRGSQDHALPRDVLSMQAGEASYDIVEVEAREDAPYTT